VTHLVLKDELLDAQTLRAIGVAPYGGADVGECLVTAARVKGTDLTSWHDAWTATAAATLALFRDSERRGRIVAAISGGSSPDRTSARSSGLIAAGTRGRWRRPASSAAPRRWRC